MVTFVPSGGVECFLKKPQDKTAIEISAGLCLGWRIVTFVLETVQSLQFDLFVVLDGACPKDVASLYICLPVVLLGYVIFAVIRGVSTEQIWCMLSHQPISHKILPSYLR